MKFFLLLLLSSLFSSCTLSPRGGANRPLSPDHEAGTPDRLPLDTLTTDSLAAPMP